MTGLHLSKVAFSCASVETLKRRIEKRVSDGVVPVVTRFMPKRADELVGGSLFWIVKQRLAARQTILGFEVRTSDGKTVIRLDPELVPVRALARRGHQGWRYLAAADAPPDLADGEDGVAALPPYLVGKLTTLALI
jgi:hypothetical protein